MQRSLASPSFLGLTTSSDRAVGSDSGSDFNFDVVDDGHDGH